MVMMLLLLLFYCSAMVVVVAAVLLLLLLVVLVDVLLLICVFLQVFWYVSILFLCWVDVVVASIFVMFEDWKCTNVFLALCSLS